MIFVWLWIGFMLGMGVMTLVQINEKPSRGEDKYKRWTE